MPITLENVGYTYMGGTPMATEALRNVNLEIREGEFIGIIGHTGSGKSTLVQHLNGLIKPTSGRVLVDGSDLSVRGVDIKKIRQKVGLVFQYPEHQLFEETVFDDIAFGPRNLKLDEQEVVDRVREAMHVVNLDFEELKDRSPFELSGGQKRRVAIAGVLAMRPKYLVLDEPTAGLDPRGRDEVLGQIKNLHTSKNVTVILVSHNMEEVGRLATRLIVMHGGAVALEGDPRTVFAESETLKQIGLGVPQITEVMLGLKNRGKPVRTDVLTVEEAAAEIVRGLSGK